MALYILEPMDKVKFHFEVLQKKMVNQEIFFVNLTPHLDTIETI